MINTKYQILNTKYEMGQGLIEMVIATAIILTGLIGVLTLAISNLTGVTESGTRIVASNLAREGVEIARNIRDTNWLMGQTWDVGLENGNDYTAIAIFNPAANKWGLNFAPEGIDDSICQLYYIDGSYIQSTTPPGGSPTIYYRLLTLDEICKDNLTGAETIKTSGFSCSVSETKVGIRIKSEVKWQEVGRIHTMVGEDRIYNWK